MTLAWTRVSFNNQPLTQFFQSIVQLNPGQTLLRTHFGWGIGGFSPARENPQNIMNSGIVFGLVTADQGSTPPTPIVHPGDVARPRQRWLWMETRYPVVTAIMGDGDLVTWTDSRQGEPTDTKGEVAVPSGLGHVVFLYASWDIKLNFPVDGNWALYFWANCLIET